MFVTKKLSGRSDPEKSEIHKIISEVWNEDQFPGFKRWTVNYSELFHNDFRLFAFAVLTRYRESLIQKVEKRKQEQIRSEHEIYAFDWFLEVLQR